MPGAGGNFKTVLVSNLKVSPVKSAILGVGTIVLAVLIIRQVMGGPQEAGANPDLVAQVVPSDDGTTEEPKPQPVRRVPRPRIHETLVRDPFAMDWLDLSHAANVEEDVDVEDDVLQLQLTLTGKDEEGQATAVVSGTVVHVGDLIAGYVIERIEKRFVVLRKDTERLKLRMP